MQGFDWAAVDGDGYPWLFHGEPQYDEPLGCWDSGNVMGDLNNTLVVKLACDGVGKKQKRKLQLLDLVTWTVAYDGEPINGGVQ